MGLAAHQQEKKKHSKKTDEPAPAKKVDKMTNLNLDTKEVENLLAEEEEFYDAIDEMEHDIGINQSMIDWANINFNSSFGDSGEFNGRVSVVQLHKCADCETNSKTIDKQMELLSKHDKQLKESQDKLKESKKQIKILEIKLEDALKVVKKFKEGKVEEMPPITIKCRECDFTGGSEESIKEHKREAKAKSRAEASAEKHQEGEGPLNEEDSKCGKCSYKNKNRVLLDEHKEQVHQNLVCQFCGNVSTNEEGFKVHRMVHGSELKKVSQPTVPGNELTWNCNPCKEVFISHDAMMNHLSREHLTEAQREGHGLYKYDSYHESNHQNRPAPCKNGDQCKFHSQYRCLFYHERPPQKRQVRQTRQVPSSQWKVVQPRWQQRNQGQRFQQPQDDQALPPWCTYGSRCKLGRPGSWNQFLLRHEGEDFPQLPLPGRQ
jgi:hypothetical protein